MDPNVIAAIIGATVAVVGTLWIEALKSRSRRLELLKALRGEAFDLFGFLQAKIHVVDNSIKAMRQKKIVPGEHVRHPSIVYRSHFAEIAVHLRLEHRNRLHIANELARVLDGVLEGQEENIVRIRQISGEIDAFDVVATKLQELREAVERALPLLRDFIDDSPAPFRWLQPNAPTIPVAARR